jgi:hypothetical protein
MRALCYTDLQATEGHEKMFTDPTRHLQLWRCEKVYQDLARIYKEERCDALWDLGDTTDDRSAIPVPAINLTCGGLAQFASGEWNIKLIGNHEQYLRNTQINVGRLFDPYFTVVSQPTIFEHEKVRIVCVPYPATDGELDAFLKSLETDKPTIFLGHFQVFGCFGHTGQLMSGVPLDRIKWVKLGLLGHIHRPQSFGHIHYIGSPFQQNWGEAGEDKRVAIVDVSEDTGQISLKWVPLTGYPKYLEVDLATFIKAVRADSEDRYRVNLKSSEEAATFYAHPLTNHAEPQYDFDVSASTSENDVQVDGDTWLPENVVRRYAEHNNPADKGLALPLSEIIDIGLQLLKP